MEKTKPTEVDIFVIAMRLQGISVDECCAEAMLETVKLIQEKGGEFTVKDSVDITLRVRKKHEHHGSDDQERKKRMKEMQDYIYEVLEERKKQKP